MIHHSMVAGNARTTAMKHVGECACLLLSRAGIRCLLWYPSSHRRHHRHSNCRHRRHRHHCHPSSDTSQFVIRPGQFSRISAAYFVLQSLLPPARRLMSCRAALSIAAMATCLLWYLIFHSCLSSRMAHASVTISFTHSAWPSASSRISFIPYSWFSFVPWLAIQLHVMCRAFPDSGSSARKRAAGSSSALAAGTKSSSMVQLLSK